MGAIDLKMVIIITVVKLWKAKFIQVILVFHKTFQGFFFVLLLTFIF